MKAIRAELRRLEDKDAKRKRIDLIRRETGR
jgi:hypothetical protein